MQCIGLYTLTGFNDDSAAVCRPIGPIVPQVDNNFMIYSSPFAFIETVANG